MDLCVLMKDGLNLVSTWVNSLQEWKNHVVHTGFMPFVCRECKEVRFCTKLA